MLSALRIYEIPEIKSIIHSYKDELEHEHDKYDMYECLFFSGVRIKYKKKYDKVLSEIVEDVALYMVCSGGLNISLPGYRYKAHKKMMNLINQRPRINTNQQNDRIYELARKCSDVMSDSERFSWGVKRFVSYLYFHKDAGSESVRWFFMEIMGCKSMIAQYSDIETQIFLKYGIEYRYARYGPRFRPDAMSRDEMISRLEYRASNPRPRRCMTYHDIPDELLRLLCDYYLHGYRFCDGVRDEDALSGMLEIFNKYKN